MKETNRQQQAQSTRRKIFLCAQELFAGQSYENVKILDICERAGVSVGAFYHHFPNKESILNEGYREFDRELELAWQRQHPPDAAEAIRFLIRSQLESIRGRGAASSLQYFKNQLTNSEKYILNKDRFFYQTLLDCVRQEVAAGRLRGDAQGIADDILRASRGLIYDWCLREGGFDLLAEGERSLDMVLLYYAAPAE